MELRKYSDDTIADLISYEPGDIGTETVWHLATLGLVDIDRNWRNHDTGSRLTQLGTEVLALAPHGVE